MKKIMIMGAPGSKKTFLALQLGRITGLKVYQIKDDTLSRHHSEEEKAMWKTAVEEIVKKEEWIIEGTQSITVGIRMKESDTVVIINEKPLNCNMRYINKCIKEFLYREKHRIRFSFKMLKKIKLYNKEYLPQINKLVNENKEHINVVYLSDKEDIDKYILAVRESLLG